MLYRLILISFLGLISACQQNPSRPNDKPPTEQPNSTEIETIGKIVWSDDDTAVAFHLKEPEAYQLYIEELNGDGARQALGKPSPYQPLAWYFMKKQAYVLRKSQDKNGRLYFDRIDLKGHEIMVLEFQTPDLDCANTPLAPAILPSNNGRYLVFSYYSDCDTLQLDFLRAKSLASVANYSLNAHATSLHWQDKNLIISDSHRQQAWQASRKLSPQVIDYQACVLPATSSGTQSAQDEIAFLGEDAQLNFSTAMPLCAKSE